MNKIHSTAIIEPGASIGEDVEIGPYAIIGPHVVIGARTRIGSHSVIEGHTVLGADNRIGHYVGIGGYPQDMKYRDEPTRLLIGDRNTIREFTTIHVGTQQGGGVTTLGDDNWIMAYVHIGHDCHIGNRVVLASNAQMAGHVDVGDWAVIGGMSGIHQFVRIGTHAMLGGASALGQDIPPFVIAAGNTAKPHGINVEGLRRRNFSPEVISVLRSAYRLLYKNNLSLEEAKIQLRELADSGGEGDVSVKIFVDFIEKSQRGILR